MDLLFSPLRVGGLELGNRLVFLPFYLAYPDADNQVNDLVLDHYEEMAASGVGLVVVENASVEPCGLGLPRTLLVSDDRFLPGLARLAERIKGRGARAVLQIHHAGRYAHRPDRIAPSAVETWGALPRAMEPADIERVTAAFAAAARRAQKAGFDMVELHGGTGYLLPQFLSRRTNLRNDAYGGDAERRMRFPLEVVGAVREAVGRDFPVGYRFLADEYMPGGLTLDDTIPFARELARQPSRLSVRHGRLLRLLPDLSVQGGRAQRGLHGALRARDKAGGAGHSRHRRGPHPEPGNGRAVASGRHGRPRGAGTRAAGGSPLAPQGPGRTSRSHRALPPVLFLLHEADHGEETLLLRLLAARSAGSVSCFGWGADSGGGTGSKFHVTFKSSGACGIHGRWTT